MRAIAMTSRRAWLWGVLACSLAGLVAALPAGCDDTPQVPPPAAGGGGGAAGGGARPGAKPAAAPTAPAAPAQPQIELADKDFVEGPGNRDPFRSFIEKFKPLKPVASRGVQTKVILGRYGLDELKLIAVVSGSAVRGRAMFRDPTGLGVSVKQGDRISKNEGRIKRILRDRVIVEIAEQSEDKTTMSERVIELHPAEAREATVSPEEKPEEDEAK